MQYFAAVLGILFIIAFVFERWATAHEAKRKKRQWWQNPPGDDLDGDY